MLAPNDPLGAGGSVILHCIGDKPIASHDLVVDEIGFHETSIDVGFHFDQIGASQCLRCVLVGSQGSTPAT
ncbi:hypothetical protein [Cupriavidus pinatubonensis]|uniref:hypothetical protein n=1 Tax=Cupriavidus pinatubonensis TaxID=248026 RepID=UPI001CC72061|nr:hypothetical protein [Cupriavidus pinatubonensis]